MKQVGKIIAGMGALIALYLLIVDSNGTVAVINSLAGASSSTVKTLQGRG